MYAKGISVLHNSVHKYICNFYIFRRCDQDQLFACPKWRGRGLQIAQVFMQMLVFALQKKNWKRNYD